jgi:hypothetical protein
VARAAQHSPLPPPKWELLPVLYDYVENETPCAFLLARDLRLVLLLVLPLEQRQTFHLLPGERARPPVGCCSRHPPAVQLLEYLISATARHLLKAALRRPEVLLRVRHHFEANVYSFPP